MIKKIILFLIMIDIFFVSIFNSAFEETHAYIFIIISFIALLLFLFIKKSDINRLKFDYSLMALVMFLPISIFFSFYKYISLLNVYIVLSAIIFYFILINVLDKKTVNFVKLSIVFIGLFSASVGFLAYVFVAKYPNFALSSYFSSHSFLAGTRICSFFQYPNSFAGFLLMPFFISLCFLKNTSHRNKILWYIISSFLLFVFYLTGSRGAFIILFLSIILLYLLFDVKNYKSITYDLFFVSLITAVFIFANSKLIYPAILANSERIKVLVNFVAGGQNKSLSDRIQLARDAVNIFLHHPIFGTGFGTFKDAMLKYRTGLFFADEPHSMPFRIFAETGITGFVIFFYFFTKSFLRGFKRNSFLFIAVLSVFLHTFLDLDFAYPIIVSLIFIGFAVLTYNRQFKSFEFNTHFRYVALIAIVGILFVSIVPNFTASMFGKGGESLIAEGKYEQALNSFKIAVKMNDEDVVYHSRLGYCYETLAFQNSNKCDMYIEDAIDQYIEASQCNTLSFIYPLYVGNLYLLSKNPLSFTFINKSFSLNPLWEPILADKALAAAYVIGKNKEAVNLADKALNFKVDSAVYRSLRYTNAKEKDSTAYTAIGFASRKKECFEKAISLYPKNGFAYLGLAQNASNLFDKIEYLRFSLEVNPCLKESRELYFSDAPLIKVNYMKNLPDGRFSISIHVLKNEELLKNIVVICRTPGGKIYHVKTALPYQESIIFSIPENVKSSSYYHIEILGVDKNGFTISKTVSPLLGKK
jgi:putative inorganic carbon (HCO3(-)) transporter